MGCGASNDPKVAVSDSIKPGKSNNSSQRLNKGGQYSDPRNLPDTQNRPAPLAFVISFDENNGEPKRPPPGRLRLEPINNQHRMTKGDIDEKMRAAEMNRERILAERAKSSGSKKRTPNHSNYSSDRNDSDANYRDEYTISKKRGGGGSGDLRMNGDYDENRQRMLKNKRIVPQPDDSDDMDRKYMMRKENDYNDRRYK